MRIALGGFGHETNSFVDHRADYAYFAEHRDRPPHVRGQDVLDWLRGGSFPLSGFLTEMEADHELIPLVWAHGAAGGTVTDDAFERVVGELCGRLAAAMPVDALYLDLHGAMVSEAFEDAEGELLRRCRAIVGDAPIVLSLDYHANLSPEMASLADAHLIFLTYPHVDRAETGKRSADVLRELLRRGRPAGRAFRKLPFLIPATSQATIVEPSASVVARTRVLDGEVVALSYAAGFPASDLYWCGPSIVCHAWTQAAADEAADEFLRYVEGLEGHFSSAVLPVPEAIAQAEALAQAASRPILIADVHDNPGGGGSGDSTGVLTGLIEAGARDALIGIFCDAEAAAEAHRAGTGGTVTLALGGKSGPAEVRPFDGTFEVVSLASGKFRTTGAVSGGLNVDIGPMAVLRIDGVEILVSSKRMQAFDRAPFEHCGLTLARYRFIILKSTVHFRAEFEPLADGVVLAGAPGGFPDDPSGFPFRKLRPDVRLTPGGLTLAELAPASQTQ